MLTRNENICPHESMHVTVRGRIANNSQKAERTQNFINWWMHQNKGTISDTIEYYLATEGLKPWYTPQHWKRALWKKPDIQFYVSDPKRPHVVWLQVVWFGGLTFPVCKVGIIILISKGYYNLSKCMQSAQQDDWHRRAHRGLRWQCCWHHLIQDYIQQMFQKDILTADFQLQGIPRLAKVLGHVWSETVSPDTIGQAEKHFDPNFLIQLPHLNCLLTKCHTSSLLKWQEPPTWHEKVIGHIPRRLKSCLLEKLCLGFLSSPGISFCGIFPPFPSNLNSIVLWSSGP